MSETVTESMEPKCCGGECQRDERGSVSFEDFEDIQKQKAHWEAQATAAIERVRLLNTKLAAEVNKRWWQRVPAKEDVWALIGYWLVFVGITSAIGVGLALAAAAWRWTWAIAT